MRDRAVSAVFDSEFIAKLEKLSLLSKRALKSVSEGTAPAQRPGAGVEFQDLRRYSAGDDFRYIDWNAYARLDELFLKLFHEEGDVCIHILVDGSASMGFGSPTKLVYASRLAAALAYVALANLDKASVVVLRGPGREGLRLLKGKKQIFRVFSLLERQEPRGGTSLDHALRLFGSEAEYPGKAVLISDLLDDSGFGSGLSYLRHLGFDPQVVHLLSPEDMHPAARPGETVMDSETGQEITIGDIDHYEKEMRTFLDSARRQCVSADVPYFLASTDSPLEDLIFRLPGVTA